VPLHPDSALNVYRPKFCSNPLLISVISVCYDIFLSRDVITKRLCLVNLAAKVSRGSFDVFSGYLRFFAAEIIWGNWW
jgi:hypothetical protein